MSFRLTCLLAPCFVLLAFLFIPTIVFAGDTLSLKDIIEEALNNNQEIQAVRHNVKAKKYMAGAEGILDDPIFKVEMEDLSKEHPLDISPGSAMQTRYSFIQMFPYPGKLPLQKHIALKEALMAEEELRITEIGIIKMIKEAYYEYQMITESIKIVEEIKDLLSDTAKTAEIKYSTGSVSQQDVIKARLEVSMLINEAINLNAEREVTAAEINALLNRSQDTTLPEPDKISRDKASPDNVPINKSYLRIDALTAKALKNNPSLRLMRYGTEEEDLKAELTKKNYYPDFMLGIAPIQRNGRFDSWDAMFQINIPIWRGRYNNQVSEAVSSADIMKSRLRSEEYIKTAEVKEWVIKVETADKIWGLYETTLLPQTELSFNSALKNYQAGKVDFITLLDAERLLKKTRMDYINALITYHKRVASLEWVTGGNIQDE